MHVKYCPDSSVPLGDSVQGQQASKGEKNFYFSFLLEALLFKNEILFFLHNNAAFLNFAYVFIGTHVSFLCG